MRLISYEANGERGVGAVVDETRFVPLHVADHRVPRTMRALLEMPDGLACARDAAAKAHLARPLAGVRFDPTVVDPNALWCLALNFKKHIEETGLTTSAEFPQIFLRMPASIVGHGQPLLCPPESVTTRFDYEGELGVVIGRGGRDIGLEHALEYVAGYTCINDGSVREFQGHNRQFGLGKNFEQSGSVGPWLVTSDEFGRPEEHTVITRVNGIERQHESLGDMLFSVEQVIAYLARIRPAAGRHDRDGYARRATRPETSSQAGRSRRSRNYRSGRAPQSGRRRPLGMW